jgi:hypothetical protein
MATQYIAATTKDIAKSQNKDWWEKVLGRPKNPQDTTAYLFGIWQSQQSNQCMIAVTDNELAMIWPKLTTQEKNFFNANVLQANDPQVLAFFGDSPGPRMIALD